MWLLEIIEYLKAPHLVANVQEFFGIEINYKIKHSENHRLSDNKEQNGYTKTNKLLSKEKCPSNNYFMKFESPAFIIKNRFWYYLFLFGTELGDEIFYSAFIPFWFWNIDGAVGRRVVLVWAIVMSIGQALKDIICWPRPACPPAVRLQSKWSQEYGMPSTHAMVGISIPFSVLIFTMNRYIYSFPIGFTIAFLWCTLICTSRLYLGMHTVLDIVAGLLLAIALMIPLIPLVDALDYYVITNHWVLIILILISITAVVYYPSSDKWTPTRGDTTMVVSVTAGVHAGAWLNYKTGAFSLPLLPPPYDIIWPSYRMLGCMILRTILGFCSVIGTKAICKSLCYTIICAILKINSKELMKSENYLENKSKIFTDLVYKYLTCFMIGINTVYLLPNVFTIIGIERPTFYTEL
ncbi:sphingosine-1-phosphate phosphatase 1-like isoform X1 [Polistes fuscatus]|uniref:sphingosine-1-phosphate phosphatase 1-like isoform X1 n=2 Tax=Polistes fuscatus TaxID=30207 RepID=UPI001CA80BB4|nr:sphingosine-1-phosphate phosphatase 1-like isoform X1 [Polistes fuscatus]XP_043503526.1 sphingosine-1-phosphate phosphatase 1-like isoform X1 [Polistes fuscatus]XP_043503527.1 sphingosine-1-phosphate phosphatase 1-like isoform X1 [Polistes fuscatus]